MSRPLAILAALSVSTLASVAGAQNASTSHSAYVVPKLGILTSGSGDTNTDCSANPGVCAAVSPGSLSLDDHSDFSLGADLLAVAGTNLRIGGGLTYVTSSKYSYRGVTETAGTDLALVGIAEGVFPVSPIVSLAVRGQAGVMFLFPGGYLKDQQNQYKTQCATAGCSVSEGPFPGFTWGIGGGAIVDVGPLGIRGDLLYQGINSLGFQKVSGGGIDATESYSGHRLWLLLGADIGL
jgi:hypothetical protein